MLFQHLLWLSCEPASWKVLSERLAFASSGASCRNCLAVTVKPQLRNQIREHFELCFKICQKSPHREPLSRTRFFVRFVLLSDFFRPFPVRPSTNMIGRTVCFLNLHLGSTRDAMGKLELHFACASVVCVPESPVYAIPFASMAQVDLDFV